MKVILTLQGKRELVSYIFVKEVQNLFVNDKTNVTEKPEMGKLQCRIKGYKLGCMKRMHFINISVLFFGHLW